MTLRQKTLLIIGIAISLFSLVLVFSAHTVLLGGFIQVERAEMDANINRAVNALSAESESLEVFLADWAVWDDTYQFIAAPSQDYLKKNLNATTFISQRIDFMLFLDSANRIVHSAAYDSAAKAFSPAPESIIRLLAAPTPLLSHPVRDSAVRGLVLLPECPAFIASRPILDSEKQFAPNGVMIVGRYLSPTLVQQIAAKAHLSLQVNVVANSELGAGLRTDSQTGMPAESRWTREVDSKTLAGYALLEDLDHNGAVILQVEMDRNIYSQGKKVVKYFLWLLVAFGALYGAAHAWLLEKTILARLASLGHQVQTIGCQNPQQLQVQMPGHDELSLLADSINGMLRSLARVQNELRESEAATRALLEGMPDTLLRVAIDGTIIDYKTARDRSAATPAKLLAGNSLHDVYPESLAKNMVTSLTEACQSGSRQIFEQEAVFGQQTHHLEIRINRLRDREALIIVRDFTARRQLEKSLEFFNLRDNLTGLFNRTYWEEKLSAVEQMEGIAAGIILCDINGMSLINESLGRDRGDRLLAAVATALRAALPLEAVIARIGNDEFAALLIDSGSADLNIYCHKILQEIEEHSHEDARLRFGITFGTASGQLGQQQLRDILQIATEQLHRNKLARSHAFKEEIFHTLQIALATRDFISHQHATRLWALGRPLAKAAGLANRRLSGLKLLTQYHDIGKVGLSDELVFRENQLTDQELVQMRQHVEIGHHIAQAIPALYPIADLILKHHEWWNGQGYPLGLAGNEIPLECRIFSIIDAYDSMTNDRLDRKAVAGNEAAAELRRCAGSQFDPDLVEKLIELLSTDDSRH